MTADRATLKARIEQRLRVIWGVTGIRVEQEAELLRDVLALLDAETEDQHYIPERDGRRCVEHPQSDHELVCLTCLDAETGTGPDGLTAVVQELAEIKICKDEPEKCGLGSGPYCYAHGDLNMDELITRARKALTGTEPR